MIIVKCRLTLRGLNELRKGICRIICGIGFSVDLTILKGSIGTTPGSRWPTRGVVGLLLCDLVSSN